MRRLATSTEYQFLNGMAPMNQFISWMAFCLGTSQILFLINFITSMWWGKPATQNPWEANTLEWTAETPVPHYNFAKIPSVYRGAYEYSTEETGDKDWISQATPGTFTIQSKAH